MCVCVCVCVYVCVYVFSHIMVRSPLIIRTMSFNNLFDQPVKYFRKG